MFGFVPAPTMVTPDDALRGRDQPVLPNPSPHTVLGTPIMDTTHPTVTVGLGCFWGAEKMLWLLDGIFTTAVGYADGYTKNPTYQEVCSGRTGHAEVVRVAYEQQTIALETILKRVLEAHDPTQGYRQGNDVGTQYRSVIFTETEDEADLARSLVHQFGEKLQAAGYPPITTQVRSHVPFYLAEDYHQQYLDKNPGGYCPVHATGITCG